eukprot:COSAG06_NODE_41298_length_392_cov_391.252560_1_plen_58_part_10
MRPDNAHTTGVQWKKPSNETELTRPAQPRHRIQRQPCLSLMHTVLYTNENAAKMALPR